MSEEIDHVKPMGEATPEPKEATEEGAGRFRVTREWLEAKRRTDEEITTLVRRYIMKEVLVTSDPRVIQSAFYVVTSLLPFDEDALPLIGALIGPMGDTVPGRAMNGYPIFLSVDFLHRDDVERFDIEMQRMMAAMGVTPNE